MSLSWATLSISREYCRESTSLGLMNRPLAWVMAILLHKIIGKESVFVGRRTQHKRAKCEQHHRDAASNQALRHRVSSLCSAPHAKDLSSTVSFAFGNL